MKVAMVFGKGLDGCGVQRCGVEMQNWALKNSIDFDIYSLTERVFSRATGHNMKREPIEFAPDEIGEIQKRLEWYDIVIFNSYPSHKHAHSTSIAFYYNLIRRLENPILVGMMHEIRQPSIDCYPFIIQIMNEMDIVYNFSTKTWFSKSLIPILPSKKPDERLRRLRLWTDIDALSKYRDEYRLEDKARRMTFIGRWSSMKGPRRVLDIANIMKNVDPSFHCKIHGIERSIGAKFDVIDHPMTKYSFKFDGTYNDNPNHAEVFGPYAREDGMKYMAQSLFGASFWKLPNDPENYGDRMEYTQIETIACGSIPVFDFHYGENNIASDGLKYTDHSFLAVWSDEENLHGTVEALLDVADSRSMQDSYREAGYEFIKKEFNSDTILPEMFADILKVGKDKNKFGDISNFMQHIFHENGSAATKAWDELILSGICPAVGFRQIEDKTVCKFVNKGRVPVLSFGKKRVSDDNALFDFME